MDGRPKSAEEAERLNREGVSFCKSGDLAKGVSWFRQSIRLAPEVPKYHLNLGNVLNQLKRWDEAETVLARALALAPDEAGVHSALATALAGLGRSTELVHRYQNVMVAQPNDTKLVQNACTALLQIGQFQSAEKLARDLVAAKPGDVDAKLLLATCLERTGQLAEAAATLFAILRQAPQHETAALRFGGVEANQGHHERAAGIFENVLRIAPGNLEATAQLGSMRLNLGQVSEAISLYRRVLDENPRCAEALRCLAMAYIRCGRLEKALESLRVSLAADPTQMLVRSNIAYLMSLMPSATRAEIFDAHREWDHHHGAFPRPAYANARDPEKRLKIGYVSSDFRQHSISYFIEPLLQGYDRRAFEVFCYASGSQFDAVTERIRAVSDHWREIGPRDDKDVMQMVLGDGIDILVDLASHTGAVRLGVFALGPAPVQITWLGYPETSGLQAMDYKITDSIASPEGDGDRFFSETLLRLPSGHHCYRPLADSPPVAPSPHLRNGYITFGSFADLSKVNPEVVAAWAAVLRATPGTRLLMKCLQFADEAVSDGYRAMFAALGIGPDRLMFLKRSATTAEHLARYSEMDIALDTFPYNGTTTICEALWMGVPVITLLGASPASRMGASLMHQVGMPELVAGSVEEFVSIASSLCDDTQRLDALRSSMRARLNSSSLRDEAGFADAMETVYRTTWRRWCGSG